MTHHVDETVTIGYMLSWFLVAVGIGLTFSIKALGIYIIATGILIFVASYSISRGASNDKTS